MWLAKLLLRHLFLASQLTSAQLVHRLFWSNQYRVHKQFAHMTQGQDFLRFLSEPTLYKTST